MDIQYSNGVASISGQADIAEAREKAVLIAGNVQGVSELLVDNLSAPQQESEV